MGSTSKKRRSTKSLGAVAANQQAEDLGPTGAERRKHTRVYLFGGRIEVSKVNGAKRELRTPLVNISNGGIFIRFVSPARRFLFFKTKPLVEPEDLIHFNLFLPPNYDPIPICGRVVRYERIDKTQVGVGIEFSPEYTTERNLERIERAIRTPVRNSERAKQIEDHRLRYSERLRAAHFEKNGEVINASQIIISSKKKKKKRSNTQSSRRRNTTEALADAPSLIQEDGQEPDPKPAKRSSRRPATERIQRLRRTSAAELSMRPLEEEKPRSKKRASARKRRKTASSSSLKTETKEAAPRASASKSRSKKSAASASSSTTAAKTSRKSTKSSSKVSASSELKRVKKSEGRRSSRKAEGKSKRTTSAEPRKKQPAADTPAPAKSESRPRTKRKRRASSEASETKKKRSRSRPAHAERAHHDPSPTRRYVNAAELHDTDIVPGDPTRTTSGRKRRPSGRRPLRARSMRTQVLTISSDVVVADSDLV